jgi:glycosyltransferase involved in cell wall biosynthesis
LHAPKLLDLVEKARDAGLRTSLRLAIDVIRAQASAQSRRGGASFTFLSQPLDQSAAAHVLMDIVEEFADSYGSRSVRILTPAATNEHRRRADTIGVRIEKAPSTIDAWIVDLHLALKEDAHVFLNGAGIARNYVASVVKALQCAKLRRAVWIIHEDRSRLPFVATAFTDPEFLAGLRAVVEAERLALLVPSRAMKLEYDDLLNRPCVNVLHYKVAVSHRYITARSVDDFHELHFLLSGSTSDGRKGHFLMLEAFHIFMRMHYDRNPAAFREFSLTLLGLGEDYLARQVRLVGSAVLGPRLKVYPEVSREEALRVASGCNATICCSLHEAFGLSVAEGMVMSHVVLRSESGGADEQLAEGENGFRLDCGDVPQLVSVLHKVLSREAMSDEELRDMGQTSRRMIAPFATYAYRERLDAIVEGPGRTG